jgi:hypothetical protein
MLPKCPRLEYLDVGGNIHYITRKLILKECESLSEECTKGVSFLQATGISAAGTAGLNNLHSNINQIAPNIQYFLGSDGI